MESKEQDLSKPLAEKADEIAALGKNLGADETKLRWGKRAIFYAAPFLILALILLCVEGGTRLCAPYISPLEAFVRVASPEVATKDKETGVYEGDPWLGWKLKPDLKSAYWDYTMFSTNRLGIRHGRPLRTKPRGLFRIICLGDSVTFGYRVPVCFPPKMTHNPKNIPYPMQIEKRLRNLNAGREIEVVAMGVPGYTSYQGVEWLKRDIKMLKPDLVTVCYGWNDTDVRYLPDSKTIENSWFSVFQRRIMRHSQAMMYISQWRESIRNKGGGAKKLSRSVPRVSKDEYIGNILSIIELAAHNGSKAAVIGQVYRDAKTNPPQANRIKIYRELLAETMKKNGVPYLKIDKLVETANPGNAHLFGELIHPGYEGHVVMADEILEFLDKKGLLAGMSAAAEVVKD